MHLVDLAGSEKTKQTGAEGNTLKARRLGSGSPHDEWALDDSGERGRLQRRDKSAWSEFPTAVFPPDAPSLFPLPPTCPVTAFWRLQEATKINQSLSALGNVIRGLVEKEKHIKFRDSKLTRLLQARARRAGYRLQKRRPGDAKASV